MALDRESRIELQHELEEEEKQGEKTLRRLRPRVERHLERMKITMRRVFAELEDLELKTTMVSEDWHWSQATLLGRAIWSLEEPGIIADLAGAESDELFQAGLIYLLDDLANEQPGLDLVGYCDWVMMDSEAEKERILSECASMNAEEFCKWIDREFPDGN